MACENKSETTAIQSVSLKATKAQSGNPARSSRSLSAFFFSSGTADVALWLGPYMSISSQNDICTKTQKVQKCRQITTNQKSHKPSRRPANPPARFAFRQSKKQQIRHTKGQEPKQKTPTKKICPRTQRIDHCVTLQKLAKLIIHHDIS